MVVVLSVVVLKCDKASFKPDRCPTGGVVDPSEREQHLSKPIAAAKRLFREMRRIHPGSNGAAIEILFLDFMERLAFFHMGIENVCSFYRCVALKGSWSKRVLPDGTRLEDIPAEGGGGGEMVSDEPFSIPIPAAPQKLNMDNGIPTKSVRM